MEAASGDTLLQGAGDDVFMVDDLLFPLAEGGGGDGDDAATMAAAAAACEDEEAARVLVDRILASNVLPAAVSPYVKHLLRMHFRSVPPPPCPRCHGVACTHFRYLNNATSSLRLQPTFQCRACCRTFTLQGHVRLANPYKPRKRKAKAQAQAHAAYAQEDERLQQQDQAEGYSPQLAHHLPRRQRQRRSTATAAQVDALFTQQQLMATPPLPPATADGDGDAYPCPYPHQLPTPPAHWEEQHQLAHHLPHLTAAAATTPPPAAPAADDVGAYPCSYVDCPYAIDYAIPTTPEDWVDLLAMILSDPCYQPLQLPPPPSMVTSRGVQ